MPTQRPPKGYKRGLGDEACRDMAERAMRSPQGQEALRGGWGRLYWQFVMDWGSTPTRPETREALKREHNAFMWDLMDMRRIEKPDELTARLLHLGEAMLAREEALRVAFLKEKKVADEAC